MIIDQSDGPKIAMVSAEAELRLVTSPSDSAIGQNFRGDSDRIDFAVILSDLNVAE
ncbi:MAG: hypothetical protein ABIS51_14780 [Sphingomonas sp.]